MYVCGPTVYGRIHVGNARPYVVFQLMKRYLEWRGQPVHLVENITDVNEKIDIAARERGSRRPSWRRDDPGVHRGHRPARASAAPTTSRWRPRRWPRSSR